MLGLGNNHTLLSSPDVVLAVFFNSSNVSLFISNSLDIHSSLSLNFNSHQNAVPTKVHAAISSLLILIFIHWYHQPGSLLFHAGIQISDQFSNFHGQSFSISSLKFIGVNSSFDSLLPLFAVLSGVFSWFFACQNKSSSSFCFSGLNSVIGNLLFITKNK